MITTTEIAFICFVLLILFSFWKTKKATKELPTLDYKSGEQLKGIAIILVVFGHLCSGFINLPDLKYSGAQGVTIFLILSGYGLTKSYLNKGIDGTFFVRRFKTVLFPYMLVTGVVILLDYFTHKNTIPKSIILSSMFGINTQVDPTMWYISFILLWYVAFYVVFGLSVNNTIKIALLLVFSFIIKYTAPSGSTLLNAPYEYSLHAFAFPIGVMGALYSKNVLASLKTKRNQISVLAAVAILLLVGFVLTYRDISIEHQTIYTIINLMLSVSLIIFITLLSYLRIESKLLVLLGAYSYEIYLFEALFFTRYDVLHKFSNKWVSLFLYIFMILLFSFVLNTFVKLIWGQYNKIKERRNLKIKQYGDNAIKR